MLEHGDIEYLRRALHRNRCVLLTGAGFSTGAETPDGDPLPSGSGLAAGLWEWMGYGDASSYDWTPLPRVFERARRSKGDAALLAFLKDRLTASRYPEWLRIVASIPWYRAYTLNVDNVLELAWRDHGEGRLRTINALDGRYRDRPEFLDEIQYIKLNGDIAAGLDRVTFSKRDYARRSGEYDTWYDHFVRDYSLFTTILVGTTLNEPLFEEALEARGRKGQAPRERRPRSFLISTDISPVVADEMKDFNVVPIRAEASDFFEYVEAECGPLPTHDDVLRTVRPDLVALSAGLAKREQNAVKALLTAAEKVEVRDPPQHGRSLYHLGAAPTWDDLAWGHDARREVTDSVSSAVLEALRDHNRCQTHLVLGHRGAGKSTLIMRVSLDAAAEGVPVFFLYGEDVPEPHMIRQALDTMQHRVLLVVDDTSWALGRLVSLLSDADTLDHPPVVLAALRANARHAFMERGATPDAEHWIGELTDSDIDRVIDVLEQADRLGNMTGKDRSEIQREFAVRSKKQLLVALREVTEGENFQKIIVREFDEIADSELRIVYLAACLATAENASLARSQLLAITEKPAAELLASLDRELNQLLVPGVDDRWSARHSVIAATVIERASRKALAETYKRLLKVLANDMDNRARRGPARRWFRLYKRIVNHSRIYTRFERNLEEARDIFDALSKQLKDDAHYWLQYGSLELEYGEVNFARHYLISAQGLAPEDKFIRNAKGHLLLLEAKTAGTREEAVRLRDEGRDLLEDLIDEWGEASPYPWHTYLSHDLDWLDVWEKDTAMLRRELEYLREMASEAVEVHPRNDAIASVRDRVERSYLATATA